MSDIGLPTRRIPVAGTRHPHPLMGPRNSPRAGAIAHPGKCS